MKENQNIEWKETWKDECLRWVCGFANAQGGTLIIGKNDTGVVTGVANSKKLMEDIPNKIRDILGIIVDVNLKTENLKEYLEIKIESYPYPVNYKGEYYYRTGSTKQELKGAALDTFLLKKSGLHWDGVPVPHLVVRSLDSTAFKTFVKKATQSKRLGDEVLHENKEALLKKLHLNGGPYLKRAAALLFHNDPEQYVTGAYIKLGFFKTDSDLLYQDEVHGNLFHQVDTTIDLLLTKYMKAFITYQGIQRVEQYLFPLPALREALLNAIVHKDYSSGNPVQISVYEDKIIFWNSGRLPEELSVDLLQKKHPSIPYNPLIASAFFWAGYIEAWGRGIEKINSECTAHGIPHPDYNYEYAGLMITFKTEISKDTSKPSGKTSGKTSGKIIELIRKNNALTIPELAEQIGVTVRSVERNIQQLQKNHLLQRIGPAKGGRWEVIDIENNVERRTT